MRKAVTLLIAVGAVVSLSAALFATVIHVPADQPTIQAGIDAAVPGDTVLVADGTYTGNGNRDIDFGGKGIVLKSENGQDFTILDCQGSSADPHRGFYFHSGEDSTAVVDGFTIQDGFGLYDDPNGYSVGGGIKCDSSSSPKIINNTISGNSADWGGGICCHDNSSLTISNNTISGNSGGGIFCWYSSPTISNNTISGNLASNGGGICCRGGSSPTISNNIISGNSAGSSGGGIFCYNNSSPTISNNTISGNSTNSYGGGISCFVSHPTITGNIISDNSAMFGGGIYCYSSNPTISYNTISDNSTDRYGGGIYCWSSDPTISNNTISENSADDYGGGIYCSGSSPTISNNTISGNSALIGSGLSLLNSSSPSLVNTIITFNIDGEAVSCYGWNNPTLTCCDVYGNPEGDWVGCIADQAGINGNFSLDPLFCDTTAGDFSLSKFSPCLPQYNSCGVLIGALDLGCTGPYICGDANGDSVVTMDDVAFLQAFYFDCGPCPYPCPASDLNCDGSVDIADIVYLAQFLNGTGPEPCCW